MALADDIADDMDQFDGVRLVTVQHRSLTGTVTNETEEVTALPRAIDTMPGGFGAGGQVMTSEIRWHLKASDLAIVPKKGDRIVADEGDAWDGEWEILTVSTQTLATRYQCNCKKVS